MKKKHRHSIETDEPCNNCGYQEGYCKKCDKIFFRRDYRKRWQEG